jgi:hypothetical protein
MADLASQKSLLTDEYYSLVLKDNRYTTQKSLLTDGYYSEGKFSAATLEPQSKFLIIDGYNSQVNFGASGTVSSTIYYKMRGYYITGAVYEVYVVTGSPSSTPPSGHTLTNVAVIDTWTI